MKKFLAVIVLLVLAGVSTIWAQCRVTGNLVDAGSEPVAFASVVLTRNSDGQAIAVLSDDKGYFCLNNIKNGDYRLTVSLLGFEPWSGPVVVADDAATVNLPDIKMVTNSTDLAEVLITGTSHISQIKPSLIKYKTSSLISQSGGTAGDILKNMPSVAMGGSPGHNRDIRFRGLGNAYTKVLINGREAGLSGNNRETVLDQIPAGSISHIEIMAVPGAEYQGEGINGIVNIVLKDNASYGLHGKVEAMGGNHNGTSGGFSISNKTEKLNVFANYDFLHRNLPKPKDKLKTDFSNGNVTQLEDSYELENKNFTNHNLRTGFDYLIQPKTKLSAEYIYGYQLEDKDRSLEYTRTDGSGKFKSAAQELKPSTNPIIITRFTGHSSILLPNRRNC